MRRLYPDEVPSVQLQVLRNSRIRLERGPAGPLLLSGANNFTAPFGCAANFTMSPRRHVLGDPFYSLPVAFALALPWLTPIHTRPWTGFHADMVMAAAFAALAVLVLSAPQAHWRLPRIALVFAALACVPVLQHAVGHVVFAGDAWLAGAYLLAFCLSIALGVALRSLAPDLPALIVLGSFGLASALSLGLALNQWLQLDLWPELSLTVAAGARVTANVAQPNKLATLFAWGLVALWWFHQQRRIRASLAVAGALMLLFGIVMTRSRVGALELLLLLGFVLAQRDARRSPRHWLTYAGLAAWFAAMTLAWTPLSQALGLLPPVDLTQRLQPGTRLLHWSLLIDAIAKRPLAGWGWQQVAMAQSALAGSHPPSGEVITYSHNLLLDLMVWNGVPVGAAIALALGAWFVSRWRQAASDTSRALMLALTVLLLHAMLELPHGYATALLPAGLMMGAVEASVPRRSSGVGLRQLPRWAVALVLGLLIAGLAVIARDYLRVEQAWTAERIRLARIGSQVPSTLPEAPIMDHLLAILELGRIEPRAGMAATELRFMEQTAHRFPGSTNLLRLARAQRLNGQPAQAEHTIRLICHTNPEQTCDAIEGIWAGPAEPAPASIAAGVESATSD